MFPAIKEGSGPSASVEPPMKNIPKPPSGSTSLPKITPPEQYPPTTQKHVGLQVETSLLHLAPLLLPPRFKPTTIIPKELFNSKTPSPRAEQCCGDITNSREPLAKRKSPTTVAASLNQRASSPNSPGRSNPKSKGTMALNWELACEKLAKAQSSDYANVGWIEASVHLAKAKVLMNSKLSNGHVESWCEQSNRLMMQQENRLTKQAKRLNPAQIKEIKQTIDTIESRVNKNEKLSSEENEWSLILFQMLVNSSWSDPQGKTTDHMTESKATTPVAPLKLKTPLPEESQCQRKYTVIEEELDRAMLKSIKGELISAKNLIENPGSGRQDYITAMGEIADARKLIYSLTLPNEKARGEKYLATAENLEDKAQGILRDIHETEVLMGGAISITNDKPTRNPRSGGGANDQLSSEEQQRILSQFEELINSSWADPSFD